MSFGQLIGQISTRDTIGFWQLSPEYNKKRVVVSSLVVGTGYAMSSVGLYYSWYKNNDQQGFHFFNDWNEWQNVDKMGHLQASYYQAWLGYKLGKWTGLAENSAIKMGWLGGLLFQTTIEIMDGFSSKWGFSVFDVSANVLGTAVFDLQQRHWKEQRIILKMSSWPETYPNHLVKPESRLHGITLDRRAKDLYGNNFAERFMKDYNAQSYWASFNINSFSNSKVIPKFLNVAIGYSAENMFGGFENRWEVNNEKFYAGEEYERYHQFLLGLDIDFSRIRTKSPFLNFLLDGFNFFRLPLPAIEYNSLGEFKFHLIFKN